jgi:adenylate cyclase class 2
MFEVELKFRVADEAVLLAALERLGARPEGTERQRDAYFNHPARDFAETDEALRVRTVGETSVVTYKGAVVGETAKSREEVETGIEDAERFARILTRLGFRPTLVVEKTRRSFAVDWAGRQVTACLDLVAGLGLFCELELMAEEGSREAAERTVWSLAERLSLSVMERKSYLEMLLEKFEKN